MLIPLRIFIILLSSYKLQYLISHQDIQTAGEPSHFSCGEKLKKEDNQYNRWRPPSQRGKQIIK